ncbi:AOC03_06830 family ribosome hibernation factor [Rappaport israeli]|uniref:AOC03_06830 family ribosome hibernation factor n=1 Tax=Rappaport israeli TaxID=1839807 RepID=UPI000AA3C129|nr:hypothetical protein [Rappaport israeli]
MSKTITRETVKQLQQHKNYPSVTLTMPTHRTSPDNDKDPIRLKNLVSEAEKRLEETFGKRESQEILEKLHQQADAIDHEHNRDGLVICVNNDFAETYKLPYRLPERVAIDDNFFTRDLVYAMNRDYVYWLLLLDAENTRLYIGRRENLHEVEEFGFPYAMDGASPSANLGKDDSQVYRDEITRMLRQASNGLVDAFKEVEAPLVVVGIERNLGYFNESIADAHDVMLTIDGGYSDKSTLELGKLIWEDVKEAFKKKRKEIFEAIGVAKGNQQLVNSLDECWQAAIDGRVDTLVVEKDLHIPAEVSEDGRSLKVLEDSKAQGERAFADIIDEMIEHVMAADGKVVFVDEASLEEFNNQKGLVAITRY